MLRPIVYVDIVGVEKETARQRILEALPDRLKPDKEPDFPTTHAGSDEGSAGGQVSKVQPDFPNPRGLKSWTGPYERNAFFTGREGVGGGAIASHEREN